MTPEEASPLRRLADRIAESVPEGDARLQTYVRELQREIEENDRRDEQTRAALAEYEQAYEKLTSPANRVGVFLRDLDDGQAQVMLGEQEFVAEIDPKVDVATLQTGTRIRLNDAYAVVGVVDDDPLGPIISVTESLEDGRLRIGGDVQGNGTRLIHRAESLREVKISAGDEVRLDASGRLAVEHLPRQGQRDLFLEEIPETPWSMIGGQEEAVQVIRETLELPQAHPEVFKAFNKQPIKGVLLYGPPGCGKTLMGKAIAWNLAREAEERTGKPMREVFLNISGPKILNMWLGESERMVREIFRTAREKAADDQLVVLFIDEAESLLRTRSGGRYLNISNTLVPQFCAEMDGLVSLDNVVIVLTSNRPDYIDPAVLRPGRIDRRIKVARPGRDDSREILGIHFAPELPIDPDEVAKHGEPECARLDLIEYTLAQLWRETPETEFLRIWRKNGNRETKYWHDFVSGALLESVVDRAKDLAIHRAIDGGPTGLRREDFDAALRAEFKEGEIFPKGDGLEDWLKLLDMEPETVARVQAIHEEGPSNYHKGVI